MSAIFGVKNNITKKYLKKKRNKTDNIFQVYVCCVDISVLICKTSPISHTVTSDFGHSLVLSDLSL